MKTNTLLPLLFSLLIAAITTYSVRWRLYYVERRYITLRYHIRYAWLWLSHVCVCVLLCFRLPSVRPHFVVQSSPVRFTSNTIYRLFISLSFHCGVVQSTHIMLFSHTTTKQEFGSWSVYDVSSIDPSKILSVLLLSFFRPKISFLCVCMCVHC